MPGSSNGAENSETVEPAGNLMVAAVNKEETTVPSGERGLSDFAGQNYLVLESYKANGNAVRTPVWFVENKGRLYVRTGKNTGKAKRLRHNPYIRIAPSNIRGTPKGDWTEAHARFATGVEAEQAYPLLRQKYGLVYSMVGIVRFIGRVAGSKSEPVILAIQQGKSENLN